MKPHRYVGLNSRRPIVPGALLLLLALMLPFAAPAANESESRKRIILINRLYENLEYEPALSQLQVARQRPHGTDEEVTLSLYEGIILCEQRKQSLATLAFRVAPPAAAQRETACAGISHNRGALRVRTEVDEAGDGAEASKASHLAGNQARAAPKTAGDEADRYARMPDRGSHRLRAAPESTPLPQREAPEHGFTLQSRFTQGTLQA